MEGVVELLKHHIFAMVHLKGVFSWSKCYRRCRRTDQTLPKIECMSHSRYTNTADSHTAAHHNERHVPVTRHSGRAILRRSGGPHRRVVLAVGNESATAHRHGSSDLWPSVDEDERHEPVMCAELQEAKEYLQGCSLHDFEDLQRRLRRVELVTRVKHGDHAIALTLLAKNGCKSIAKEVRGRYLRACGFWRRRMRTRSTGVLP